jgi:short-subunit dehydrogenase
MTKKTIVVCGHGPGISDAVARKFGAEGYAVALVARSGERLAAAARSLAEAGVQAAAFPCDLADEKAVRGMVREVRASLGPIHTLHWNAYTPGAGDLLSADPAELRRTLEVAAVSLVAAVQEALPDLTSQKGAVLVTGGGLCNYVEAVDEMAVSWGAMGLAVSKAAQHKVTGLLAAKLAPLGVYVGEAVVMGAVKGTAFDAGHATLEASQVAAQLWSLHEARAPRSVNVSG